MRRLEINDKAKPQGEKRREGKKTLGKLVRQLSPVLAIASFVIALFFISFNLTGNSIGGLTQENFRLAGTILFVLGLVFVFVYFKNKK